jgi:hypothetical protein
VSADPRSRTRSRLFSLALACFPPHFRERYGEDMAELFDDQRRAARAESGAAGVAALWLRTLPAMVRAGLLERHTPDPLAPTPSYPEPGEKMLETLTADLRFALRMLRKSPVFAVVSVLCISIGSGAVTTIYSAMNALVLRPLPGATNGGALIRMERKEPGGNDGVSASYPLYELLRDRARTLDGVVAWGKGSFTIRSADEEGVEIYGNFVTANFFDVLAVRPLVGRFFVAEEGRTELMHPVIVISERVWRARFNGDAGVVGRPLSVNGHPYTIVGVAPALFQGCVLYK